MRNCLKATTPKSHCSPFDSRILNEPMAAALSEFGPSCYNIWMLTPTQKIWHNGRFIPWDEAKIHVLSHVVSYGSSVFEGLRCYATSNGPAIFRLHEHVRRMVDSAHIYRMDLPFNREQIAEAILELVRVNGLP